MDQPAYRLAVQVCNQTADKLQRQVCQYFTDVIVNNSQESEFDEVQKAHSLIKRLHHACPALLHNVVPQLEEELRTVRQALRRSEDEEASARRLLRATKAVLAATQEALESHAEWARLIHKELAALQRESYVPRPQ